MAKGCYSRPTGLVGNIVADCATTVVLLLVIFGGSSPVLSQTPKHAMPALQKNPEQLRSEALQLVTKATIKDLTDAVWKLRQSIQLFRAAKENSAAAADYLSIGEIYFIWSRYKLALEMYRSALFRTARTEYSLRCSIFSHMAATYATMGNLTRSLKYAKQASHMAVQSTDSAAKAEAEAAMGLALLYSKPEQALSLFRSARETFRNNGDADGRAEICRYMGWVLGSLDAGKDAMNEQINSLQLWTSTGNVYGVAKAHAALGLLRAFAGETDQALADFEEAKRIFHKIGDRDNEAIVLNGFGLISEQLGDYEKSLEYFNHARELFTAIHDEFGAIGAIDGAAKALMNLREYQRAKSLYRIKLVRAQRAQHYHNEADAFADLADIYATEGQYRRAEMLYSRGILISQSAHDIWDEIGILIRLGHLYQQMRQFQKAKYLLRKALEFEESDGGIARQARAHYELARLYDSLHELDQANAESEKTVQIIESERTKVSDFDSRATYFASVHDYYQLYIHVLMELDKEHPGQGFAQRAFEAAERSKVRSLLDMLASSQANSECDKHNEPDQRVREAGIAVKDNGCHPAPSALSLRQIQEEIRGDDAVLLEYALGPQASYLWAVDQEHIAAYPLPGSEQILRLARLYRTALMARQPIVGETAEHYDDRVTRADHEISGIAQELSGLLLTPAADYLHGKRRVIVVSEGPLQYIPFATLPFENSPALAANYEVVTLPSFSILKELRDGAAKRPPPTQAAAVFADPVFSKDDERVSQSLAADRHPAPIMLATALRDVQFGSANIPRLRGSRKEAEDILNAFSSNQVLESLDFDASLKTVLSADLQQYRYLHFATHGVLDAAHPEFSGLILSLVNSKGEPEDGYLRLRDIYNLKLSADLVVLSSCDSALGKDLQSEGIIGLPRAFLYAGAERVISSLWKVDDQATAAFMQHFYSHIHAGDSPASALRATQSELASDSRWSNPYYWAGFILQGEYR